MFQYGVVGLNHGVEVVADFPCSDLCPSYTVRMIHYDVPQERCAEAGGVKVSLTVPHGIGVVQRGVCVPTALAPLYLRGQAGR
jgi:hypothetical protein